MSETERDPTCGASLGATINTGNFENYKIDVWVTSIPVDATDEVIAERMKQSKSTLYKIIMGLADELGERIADVREGHK